MNPKRKCSICGAVAWQIVDRWGTAPCLFRLGDNPNPDCLEEIIHDLADKQRDGEKGAR